MVDWVWRKEQPQAPLLSDGHYTPSNFSRVQVPLLNFHSVWTAFAGYLDLHTPTMPDTSPVKAERPVASRNQGAVGPALLVVVLVGG